MQEKASLKGMSITQYVLLLEQFYELQHLELLLSQIKSLCSREVITPTQVSQLSVMYTYLQFLNERIGFIGR